MADLAGRATGTTIDAPIQQKARPDTGGDLDIGQVANGAARAVSPFADGTQLGVIVEGDGTAQPFFQGGLNGEAVPTRHDGWRDHSPGLGKDGTGHAYA